MNVYIWFALSAWYMKCAETQIEMAMETFVSHKKCPEGGIFSTLEQQRRLAKGSLGSLVLDPQTGYDVVLTCRDSELKNNKSTWITTDTGRFSRNMCRMTPDGRGRHFLWLTVFETKGGKKVFNGRVFCGSPESTKKSNRPVASATLPSSPLAIPTRADDTNQAIPPTQATRPSKPSGRRRGKPAAGSNRLSPARRPPDGDGTSPQIDVTAADAPIVHLSANCPPTSTGTPGLHLTADVPAYAKANCKNGPRELSTTNHVHFNLAATFKQSNPGEDCQLYKKIGSSTFTVDVEVGWGEEDSEVIVSPLIKTMTCAYDSHGNAVSDDENISDWFLAPKEIQTLRGATTPVTFSMKVVDVLNKEIHTAKISIGRKIRLVATNSSGTIAGFRALSCNAENNFKSYAILRAGCGDGHIFPRTKGFLTVGNVVYSPFFNAFHLRDGDRLRFECHFTVCSSRCDGSSCPTERRRRRSPYLHKVAHSQTSFRKRYRRRPAFGIYQRDC